MLLDKSFYTINESAEILGVTYATLQSHIHRNKVKSVRIGSKAFIAKEELERAIDKGAVKATREQKKERMQYGSRLNLSNEVISKAEGFSKALGLPVNAIFEAIIETKIDDFESILRELKS